MAFEKIEHSASRGRTTEPSLHIRANGQAYLNSSFAKKYGIKTKDNEGNVNKVTFNLLYDKETNQLGLVFDKNGSFTHPVRDNGQIMFYVKGCFESIGLAPVKGVYSAKKKDDMFVFQMPEKAVKEKSEKRTDIDSDTEKLVKKTKRKKKQQ